MKSKLKSVRNRSSSATTTQPKTTQTRGRFQLLHAREVADARAMIAAETAKNPPTAATGLHHLALEDAVDAACAVIRILREELSAQDKLSDDALVELVQLSSMSQDQLRSSFNHAHEEWRALLSQPGHPPTLALPQNPRPDRNIPRPLTTALETLVRFASRKVADLPIDEQIPIWLALADTLPDAAARDHAGRLARLQSEVSARQLEFQDAGQRRAA